jgi:DNA repair ATPase RecN
MRLPPVPGPRDVLALVERGGDAVEQLLGAVPRLVSLLDDAEALVRRAGGLVDGIDATRSAADEVVERTDGTVRRADELLAAATRHNERLAALLDRLEPPLTLLQPTLDRLAETTDAREVDAMVELVDHLPALAHKMDVDIVPVLDSLSSVAPDLHDLLDVSRELNQMLGQIPGLSRMKARIDKQQEADGRG